MLRVVYGSDGSKIGEGNGDCEGGGNIRGQDVKTGKVEEAVLPSLSLSYSNDDKISIYDSRPSSCPTYMFY